MKKSITVTTFIEKKLPVILAYFALIFALALSYLRQNCNYSRMNRAVCLKFSGKT